MALPDTDARSLRLAVAAAAGREEAWEAVQAVYREVAAAVEARRPVCVMSGRCCRFEEYGHRLYVTTLELAAFQRDFEKLRETANGGTKADAAGTAAARTALQMAPQAGGCRFQVGKLCGVHAIRPFGCRLFFCDETSTQWQQELYEVYHGRLKRLHEELGVPYFYVEWRAGLEAIMGGELGAK